MTLRRSHQIALVLAVAVAVGVAVFFLVDRSGSGKESSSSTAAVSQRSLRALGAAVDHPVYWAGPRAGATYEFTETSDRRTYVRYLPHGTSAGSTQPLLTVATYPMANAYAVTRRAATRPGVVKLADDGNVVAFYSPARPTNVYLAFRNEGVQVEAYDPSAGVVRKLVAANAIRSVTAAGAAQVPAVHVGPAVTSVNALKSLAAKLGRPIYWLGTLPGKKLELTRAPDGRIYLRYLPARARAGASKPYLTVATYPVADGIAATKAAARGPGTVRIPLPNGTLAFFSRARPTNVYVAFPKVGAQIEVFDPSARIVRKLVGEGRVASVP